MGDKIVEEGRDKVTGRTTSSPLDTAQSCNRAIMPTAGGALWYLDMGVGDSCKELECETGGASEL
uniref:Uncharacterized protein n=1 Tax=Rhizophora mucronata TaxID=61149 RepID=A0A2P2N757_RHIMU